MRLFGFDIRRAADVEDEFGSEALMRTTGIVEPAEEDMAAINALARETLTPEDVYVFESVVSTDALDCYFTRQAESSVRNYVEDARSGNPLLACHDSSRLPIGRSFYGRLEESDGLTSVVVHDYMVRGHQVDGINTDEVARGIRAGTLSDMSIRFGGASLWYRCGLCGLNLFDERCPHVPGVKYGDEIAFAWVEDARMVEHSIVYSSATPGAVIRKARSMAAEGRLSRQEVGFLEDAWRVRLSGEGLWERMFPQEEITGEEIVRTMQALFGDGPVFDGLETVRRNLPAECPPEEALHRSESIVREAMADIRFARALREMGFSDERTARTLADDARAYRESLVDEALSEGIRAHGEGFDTHLWRRILEEQTRTPEELIAFRDTFRQESRERLGTPGRRTVPGDPNDRAFDAFSPEEERRVVESFLSRTR